MQQVITIRWTRWMLEAFALIQLLTWIVLFFVLVGAGIQTSISHHEEVKSRRWLHGMATIVGKSGEGWFERRLELEGAIVGGIAPVQIQVNSTLFEVANIGDEVDVLRDLDNPGTFRCGSFDDKHPFPPLAFFILATFLPLPLAFRTVGKLRKMQHKSGPIIRQYPLSSTMGGGAIVSGFMAVVAGFIAVRLFSALSPETVRAEGEYNEAIVLQKSRERGRRQKTPRFWIDLKIMNPQSGTNVVSTMMGSPLAFAKCNKGEIVTVWHYQNQWFVDAHGNS